MMASTGPVGTIVAAFPAITAKHFAFAPILIFDFLGTAVATAVSSRDGRANGRTSGWTGGRTHSSKPPKDISECTDIILSSVVDWWGCTGIALLIEAVNSRR
mmetsp:Transcript_8614/g.18775  ORF Transcript_8614/g.18775 Transcript_8614/m.18775 type:complete len:102 (+) Transcript_8614:152-457(+)